MRPPAKVHYLPHNEKVWTPATVGFVKTITREIPGTEPKVLELAGWIATVALRRNVRPGQPDRRTGSGIDGASLAQWLSDATKGRESAWLFTHNVPLDLVTTRLPLALHAQGWSINEASLSGSAPWLRMAKGSRRICIVDSFSWLPHQAAQLADLTGKPAIRREAGEHPDDWAKRSANWDLRIISDAMLTLLDWWDTNELGRWTVSGPGCGWNAMRHIPTAGRVVIDPDPAGVAADRASIHGGRRGAWIVGTRTNGPFLELDFTNAYPSVAAGLPLPSQRTSAFESMALDNWRIHSDRWGIIADCELRTDVPRWPVRFRGGTFCPVGRFRTVLAGPEIRDALRLGCLVSIGHGHVHQLTYHLQPWANWIIATTHGRLRATPAEARLAAKGWSRSVIGKWAARSYERVALGHSPELGWGYTEGWDHETQTRGAFIDLAGERWWSGVAGDAEQAYPAVFGWVESETRVRLSRVIEAIGERAILQCDTDGLIATERLVGTRAAGGHLRAPSGLSGAARVKWVLDQLDPIIAPLTIRVKATHKRVEIIGPQHHIAPGDRTLAGVPKSATEIAPHVFTYEQWPGLASQMSQGDPRGYVRPTAKVTIRGPYAPGWVTTLGDVVPVETTFAQDGSNRIVSWHHTQNKPPRAKLAAKQHPVLEAIW